MLQTFLFGIDQIESTSAVTLHVTLQDQRFGMILGTEDAERKTLFNPVFSINEADVHIIGILESKTHQFHKPKINRIKKHVLIVNKRRMDKRSFDEELTELNMKVTELTSGSGEAAI
ncbi:hypothetical protein LXL04_016858 [Taraxacum kok-saghyz]